MLERHVGRLHRDSLLDPQTDNSERRDLELELTAVGEYCRRIYFQHVISHINYQKFY